MSLLASHWSFDPFLVVVAVAVGVHARGLHRLNAGAPAERARRRRRQAAWFYLGVGVLVVAVTSPVDYWSESYFWMHMVQHLLLMFAAPVPMVAGAPWIPLQHGVPAGVRRRLGRSVALGHWAIPLRAAGRSRVWPWVGVVGLNAALLVWHLPGPFDLAEQNSAVHIWLMHGSFFVLGLLFWLQFVESRPFKVRLGPVEQIGAIFATACVMWVIAMALSIFSKGSWYSWYQVHEGGLLPAFADQQIGAGIMWTCGGFWAVPAMIRAIRRLIEQRGDEGLDRSLDALLHGARTLGTRGSVHAEMARRVAEDERRREEERLARPHVGGIGTG